MGKSKKEETKKEPSKPFAEMSPEEQAAYVAQLEADKKAAEDAAESAKDENTAMRAKLKAAKIDDVDTSFEVDKKKYDFVGKKVHIFGETVDVRNLVTDGSKESLAKFDRICVELVKINSGLIKPL